MTDGIIQEVIKKIILDTPSTWYHRSTFITLEQELIEKIKQSCINRGKANFITVYDLIGVEYDEWDELIGDNQE